MNTHDMHTYQKPYTKHTFMHLLWQGHIQELNLGCVGLALQMVWKFTSKLGPIREKHHELYIKSDRNHSCLC